jgi:hypothetical protein
MDQNRRDVFLALAAISTLGAVTGVMEGQAEPSAFERRPEAAALTALSLCQSAGSCFRQWRRDAPCYPRNIGHWRVC